VVVFSYVLLLPLLVDSHQLAITKIFDLDLHTFYQITMVVNNEGTGLAWVVIFRGNLLLEDWFGYALLFLEMERSLLLLMEGLLLTSMFRLYHLS
jgi:hypothetical protein